MAAQPRALRSSSRRPRGSRGRPSGTPSRSRRARLRAPPRPCPRTARGERLPADVPLERDPAHDPLAEAAAFATTPFAPSAPDDEGRRRPPRRRGRRHGLGRLRFVDATPSRKSAPAATAPLREVQIEPPALGHVMSGSPGSRPSVRRIRPAPPCARRRARRPGRRRTAVLQRAARESAPARLVAREPGLVHEENPGPARAGGSRSRSPPARLRRRGRRSAPPLDRRGQGRRGATRARDRTRPAGGAPRSGDVEPTRGAEASLVRAVTYLALAAGVALLAVSIGLGLRDRGEQQRASDQALTSKAADQATRLEEYFARARSIMLITAQQPFVSRASTPIPAVARAEDPSARAGGPRVRERARIPRDGCTRQASARRASSTAAAPRTRATSGAARHDPDLSPRRDRPTRSSHPPSPSGPARCSRRRPMSHPTRASG